MRRGLNHYSECLQKLQPDTFKLGFSTMRTWCLITQVHITYTKGVGQIIHLDIILFDLLYAIYYSL